MEVRSGYVRADVGIIPDDWEVRAIGLIFEFKGGSQPQRSLFRQDWQPGFIRLIQIRDYKTDRYATYVPEHLVRRFCTDQDIMIGRYGPPVFQILRGLNGAYNVALIKATTKTGINHNYAYYLIKQSKIFRFIDRLSQRSSGQTGVDLGELRGYLIAFPPTLAEQEAIAEALSDADALIESLEQLLTKKRQIKQGAMQELLTGKKRLPGFEKKKGYKQTEVGLIPEDWVPTQLQGICAFITKGATPTTYGFNWESHGVLFLRSECVSEDGLDLAQSMYISPSAHAAMRRSQVCDGDLLITITGNVGRVVHLKGVGTANLNQHIARIRIDAEHVDARFVFHFISQRSVRTYFERITTGQAYPQISLKQVREAEVPLPPTLAEQKAIATILSDIDEEIAALETKLDKARQIKQGMMQELLTGRIRLI